ncbi:hypothetical protein NEUTE1DRAFT_36669 [Neurospora tetrasperma FGSC 2508]|uniref:Uncharacterized protein n=1 Tax=Neurospora tetrasperma (strain FGSC 2508 / ATCC MYA-4615 / P0657) TaxID=510951 RepID=F8MD76_NEUT8|nr:uncharacterized protein NEUTE1DRAFT_36669 [Neurospora tetrasperma FGSC 2508]EGO61421.1 hypothetical protein NEUTE1DRAFT_36669 [Neurospora tetrasperma FGSC 2508]EGZ74551.1 hypothetical protein NEUTE2DRAFT_58149 [Neurospora tetrasperma FGSC 2509]
MAARAIVDPSPSWASLLPPSRSRSRSRSSSRAWKPKPTGVHPNHESQLQIQTGSRAGPRSTTSLVSSGSRNTTTTTHYSGGTVLRRYNITASTTTTTNGESGLRAKRLALLRRSSNFSSREWRHDPKRNKKAQEAARRIIEGCHPREKKGGMRDRVKRWGRELGTLKGLRGSKDGGAAAAAAAGRRGEEGERKKEARWSWKRGWKGDNGLGESGGQKSKEKPAAAAAAAAEQTRWQLALGPGDETTSIPAPSPVPKPPRNSVVMEQLYMAEGIGVGSTKTSSGSRRNRLGQAEEKDTANRKYANNAGQGREVHEHEKMQSKQKNRTSRLWKRGMEKVKKLLVLSTDKSKAQTTTTMARDNKTDKSDNESMVAPPTTWYIDDDEVSHFEEGKRPRSAEEKGKGIDYSLYHEDSVFKTQTRGFPPPRRSSGPKERCKCYNCTKALLLRETTPTGNQENGSLLQTYQRPVPSYQTTTSTRSSWSISSNQTPPEDQFPPRPALRSSPMYLGSLLPPYQATWALPPLQISGDFSKAPEFTAFTHSPTGHLSGTFQESAIPTRVWTETWTKTPTKAPLKLPAGPQRTNRSQRLLKHENHPYSHRQILESEEDRSISSSSGHVAAEITSNTTFDSNQEYYQGINTQEHEYEHERYDEVNNYLYGRAPSYVGLSQRTPDMFFTRSSPRASTAIASSSSCASSSAPVSPALLSHVSEESNSNTEEEDPEIQDNLRHQSADKHGRSHPQNHYKEEETGERERENDGLLRHARTASFQVETDLLIIPLEEVEEYVVPPSSHSSSSSDSRGVDGEFESTSKLGDDGCLEVPSDDAPETNMNGHGERRGGGWRIVDGGNGRVNERGGGRGGVNIEVRELEDEGTETETDTEKGEFVTPGIGQ